MLQVTGEHFTNFILEWLIHINIHLFPIAQKISVVEVITRSYRFFGYNGICAIDLENYIPLRFYSWQTQTILNGAHQECPRSLPDPSTLQVLSPTSCAMGYWSTLYFSDVMLGKLMKFKVIAHTTSTNMQILMLSKLVCQGQLHHHSGQVLWEKWNW